MILESAQLLSTAHRVLDNNDSDVLYKATHKNHPTAKWVRSSRKAYQFTYDVFIELCKEYTHRNGRVHASYKRLADVLRLPPVNITDSEWVDPPMAMPDQYRNGDTVKSYRQYYIGEKVKQSKWTKRAIPEWVETE